MGIAVARSKQTSEKAEKAEKAERILQ